MFKSLKRFIYLGLVYLTCGWITLIWDGSEFDE
jgi:hypothetical protein